MHLTRLNNTVYQSPIHLNNRFKSFSSSWTICNVTAFSKISRRNELSRINEIVREQFLVIWTVANNMKLNDGLLQKAPPTRLLLYYCRRKSDSSNFFLLTLAPILAWSHHLNSKDRPCYHKSSPSEFYFLVMFHTAIFHLRSLILHHVLPSSTMHATLLYIFYIAQYSNLSFQLNYHHDYQSCKLATSPHFSESCMSRVETKSESYWAGLKSSRFRVRVRVPRSGISKLQYKSSSKIP